MTISNHSPGKVSFGNLFEAEVQDLRVEMGGSNFQGRGFATQVTPQGQWGYPERETEITFRIVGDMDFQKVPRGIQVKEDEVDVAIRLARRLPVEVLLHIANEKITARQGREIIVPNRTIATRDTTIITPRMKAGLHRHNLEPHGTFKEQADDE